MTYVHERAFALFDRMSIGLIKLFGRWIQERKNFEDYEQAMADALTNFEPKAVFIKATTAPFGFSYRLGKNRYVVTVTHGHAHCKAVT